MDSDREFYAQEGAFLAGTRTPEASTPGIRALRYGRLDGGISESVDLARRVLAAARSGSALPSRFVEACATEETDEEAAARLRMFRALSPAAQQQYLRDERWSVDDWLWWTQRENRVWYWVGAQMVSGAECMVFLRCPDMNASLGAFDWLMRATGLRGVE